MARHLIFPIEISDPGLYRILVLILGNSSVLFVFIAGFLFKHLLDRYRLKAYITKKLSYVFLPYLFMSIPALLLYSLELPFAQYNLEPENYGFASYSLCRRLILVLLYGAHLWHFWFIPMIALIYFSAPLFVFLDRHPNLYWLLPLMFTGAFFIGRQTFAPVRSFIYFFPVYLFGMLICRMKERLFIYAMQKRIVSLLLVSGLGLLSYAYIRSEEFELLYFQKILFALAFILFFHNFSFRPLKTIFSKVADYSFTIYFIHMYIHIFLTYMFMKLDIDFNSELIKFLIMLFLNIGLSIMIAHSTKIILGNFSRYIIGS